jgi:hypothetical protein
MLRIWSDEIIRRQHKTRSTGKSRRTTRDWIGEPSKIDERVDNIISQHRQLIVDVKSARLRQEVGIERAQPRSSCCRAQPADCR